MKSPVAAGGGAALSERGRRSVNQDAALLLRLPDGAQLAAVADGMGGSAGGEVASTLALTTLRRAVEAGADLEDAVQAANRAVHAEAEARPELRGMGTTLVAALRRGDRYSVAHVGDSRAYRIDADGISRLTEDHSFMVEAVRSGHMTAEEAARSRWRNSVTRAIGVAESVDVECTVALPIDVAHTLLLCSDGLYRALPDAELHRLVKAAATPAAAVRALTDAALAAGSDDNISVTLLSLVPAQEKVADAPAHRPAPPPRAVLLPDEPGRRRSRTGWTPGRGLAMFRDTLLAFISKKLRRS